MSSVKKEKTGKTIWKKKKAKDDYTNLIVGMSKKDAFGLGGKKASLKHISKEESTYKIEKGFKIKRSPSITQRSMADSDTTRTALLIPNLALKDAFFNFKDGTKADENVSFKTERSLRQNFLLKSPQIVQFKNTRRDSETQHSGFLTDRKLNSSVQKTQLGLSFRLQKTFSKGKLDRSASKAARTPQLVVKVPRFKFTRKLKIIRNDLQDTNEAFSKKILSVQETSQEQRIKELVSFNRFLNTRSGAYRDHSDQDNLGSNGQTSLRRKLMLAQTKNMERDKEEEENEKEDSSSNESDEEAFQEYDYKRNYEGEATVLREVFRDLLQAINGTLHYEMLAAKNVQVPESAWCVAPTVLLIKPFKSRLITAPPITNEGYLKAGDRPIKAVHGVTLMYSNNKRIVYCEDEVENDLGHDSIELWGFNINKMVRKQFEFEKLNLLLFSPVMRIMNSTHTMKLIGYVKDTEAAETKDKRELFPRKSTSKPLSHKSDRSTKSPNKREKRTDLNPTLPDLFSKLLVSSQCVESCHRSNYLLLITKIRSSNKSMADSLFERQLKETLTSRPMPDITDVRKAMGIAFPMILINKIGKDSPTEFGGQKECHTPRKRMMGSPRKESLKSKYVLNSPSGKEPVPQKDHRRRRSTKQS